jgi:hypothetical protein
MASPSSPSAVWSGHRHSGSSADGSTRSFSLLRGQLLLQLRAGTHHVALQWRSFFDEKAVSWMELNTMDGGFFGGDNLLAIVNTQRSAPKLRIRNESVLGWEDTMLYLLDMVAVTDIDEAIVDDYYVALMVQVANGALTLATRDRLTFLSGDGTDDPFLYFTGIHAWSLSEVRQEGI